MLDISQLMKLIWLFRNEADTNVWIILLKHIQPLSRCLLNTDLYAKFQKFLSQLLKNIIDKLGFELKPDEGKLFMQKWSFNKHSFNWGVWIDDLTLLLHEKVLYAIARLDNQNFVDYAAQIYKERSIRKIPANLQKPVDC